MGERQKIVHTPEVQKDRYDYYCKVLGLTDAILKKVQSIFVVGSAANDFVATLSKRHPHIFAVGTDPKEGSYKLLHPYSINHDARDIGIPDDAPKFDLTISVDAVPKYFGISGEGSEESSDIFDHSILDELPKDPLGSIQGAARALSEMVRVTKANGKVIVYPTLTYKLGVLTRGEMEESDQGTRPIKADEGAFFLLKREMPKLAFSFIADKDRTSEERARQGKPVFVSRVEIRKRS